MYTCIYIHKHIYVYIYLYIYTERKSPHTIYIMYIYMSTHYIYYVYIYIFNTHSHNMWITKQFLAFIFCFTKELNPYTPLISILPLTYPPIPSPPRLCDAVGGAFFYLVLRMPNPCRRQAIIITLGANATTCRRQAIIITLLSVAR
jgi:hypothetical protein